MVSKIIHKKIGVSAEYVKFCRRVFGDENLVEIYRNSAENNIFLAGRYAVSVQDELIENLLKP